MTYLPSNDRLCKQIRVMELKIRHEKQRLELINKLNELKKEFRKLRIDSVHSVQGMLISENNEE